MVVDDLLAQVLLLQQALQVEAVLGERRVDRLVVGQEQRDALRLVRQDVCAARTGSVSGKMFCLANQVSLAA